MLCFVSKIMQINSVAHKVKNSTFVLKLTVWSFL